MDRVVFTTSFRPSERPSACTFCDGHSCSPSTPCHYLSHHHHQYEGLGWQGEHCEGGLLRALFALLMWEVLFDGTVPWVFQTRFQAGPLDLGTPHFFEARKEQITARLQVWQG